jgi:RNA polymerase sigma factor (sigma-70 family)
MRRATHPAHDAQTLVTRCRAGDATAWQLIVKEYAALVHSVPVRYGLSQPEVEDVAQEVFFALAQGLHALEDADRLPAWLLTTARRYTWRALQQRRREAPAVGADVAESDLAAGRLLAAAPPTISELFAGWARQELLAHSFNSLGDRCRLLLSLIFLDADEPSYEAIAERLAIPKGSIGPTRNRCLQQLRAILTGLGYADER